MKINDAGAVLIKSFESCRLRAYLPTQDDVPTIGWGRTSAVAMGDTCTQDEADAWFLIDVAIFEDCVNKAVTVPLTSNEFSACVSLAFNIGCGAFGKSTLVKMLNDSDFDGASMQFGRFVKQGPKTLAGLVRRRAAEAELFESA